MPMSGWLAAGAVAAALLLGTESGAEPRNAAALLLGAGAVGGLGWLLGVTLGRLELVRALAAPAAGAGAIALRLLLASPAVPAVDLALPAGDGPWSAMIVSVGFLSAFEGKGAPSVRNRFLTSHVWPH